jgi:hypothetical protein
MNSFGKSELTPFSFESTRRGAAYNTVPVLEMPNLEREGAMRLMREPSNPWHRKLSQAAERWLCSLPETLRPEALVRAYPRIANRLAQCWIDHELREKVLADLLEDRRKGRKGFPAAVHAELAALSAFSRQQ